MITRFIARCCSIILGIFPFIVLIYIIIARSSLTHTQYVILMPLILFLEIGIPFGYVIIAYLKKNITDLDLTDRKERIVPFLVAVSCSICSLIAIYFIGNIFLLKLFFLLFILIGINAIITVFWKISLHMAANVVFVILMNYFYQWKYPWLFILIPVVYWSRRTLKKHTVMQLIVSLILNAVIVIGYLKYLKLSAP